MIQRTVFLVFLVLSSGCEPTCEEQGKCERECPDNTWAVCTDEHLCRCESFGDVLAASELSLMSTCADPQPNDLLISEVLIDGEPTEEYEFVELMNMTDEYIRLDALSIWIKRGQTFKQSITLRSGCLPPRGILLLSDLLAEPKMSPSWQIDPKYGKRQFSFSNSSDFAAQIRLFDTVEIDEVQVSRDEISPGISSVRNSAGELEDHRGPGRGLRSSPGACHDGATLTSHCPNVPSECRKALPRELVINELMVDGEPESEEFIEIVNNSTSFLDLAGLSIEFLSDQTRAAKIHLWNGCLPPSEAIAFYAAPEQLLAQDDVIQDLSHQAYRFKFPNNRGGRLELKSAVGDLLDIFSYDAELIEPGVSLNRFPDVVGIRIVPHSQHFDEQSSPGLRALAIAH